MHSNDKVIGNLCFDIEVSVSLRVRDIDEGQSSVRKKMLESYNYANSFKNQQVQKSSFRISESSPRKPS